MIVLIKHRKVNEWKTLCSEDSVQLLQSPPPLNAMSKDRISAIKKMGGGYTWIKGRQVAGKETCRW